MSACPCVLETLNPTRGRFSENFTCMVSHSPSFSSLSLLGTISEPWTTRHHLPALHLTTSLYLLCLEFITINKTPTAHKNGHTYNINLGLGSPILAASLGGGGFSETNKPRHSKRHEYHRQRLNNFSQCTANFVGC